MIDPFEWLDLDIQVQRSLVAKALTLRYGHKKRKKAKMEHGNHIRLRNIHDYWVVVMDKRQCLSATCDAKIPAHINAIGHGAASTTPTPTPTPMLGGSKLDPS